jgi:carbon-monoxide dehydrogenase medium subunit
MQQIEFHSPSSIEDVCALLAEDPEDTTVIAGGQSLVQMLKGRLVGASKVIDISNLAELEGIERTGGQIRIGAAETYAAVRRHSEVRSAVPVLPKMIATIGDTQIRNRGTLVGGIAHADPQGDPPVLATALNAELSVRSADGERTVPGREFYRGLFETALAPDELVTEVAFPVPEDRTELTFRSFTPRDGDYAVATVVPSITVEDGGEVTDVTITVGAVGDRPQVIDIGTERTSADAIADHVAEAASVEGDEEWSEQYRRDLIESLTVEALRDLELSIE